MNMQIYRRRIREKTCDGILRIDGKRICDTAEHSLYRLPAGTYLIVLKYSKEYGRKMPMLVDIKKEDTSPKACLAIGNGVFNNKDGSILLGTHIVPGCLKCSRQPFMQLYDRINKSIIRGHEVTLTITE